MSTACDLLLGTCGIKDHNSPSTSTDQSAAASSSGPSGPRRGSHLLQSLKQLLRVRGQRSQQTVMTSPLPPQQPPQPPQPPAAPKPQVYVVGSPNPKSPYLRIAHISDTCGLPDSGHSAIYEADVIVHSGNLCPNQLRKHFFRDAEFVSQLKAINEFFAGLPHRYKIFVPGPNESAFAHPDDRERIQALLPNCIYLCDSGCLIEGVRFHGVGCSGGGGIRFGRLSSAPSAWSTLPESVDVLVSHSLPTNSHYEELMRLRPKMLLYGSRMHRSSRSDQPPEDNCVKFKDSVIFSNGHAGNSACKRGLFDFYVDEAAPRETRLPVVSPEAVSEAFRSLPQASAGGDGSGRNGGLLRCILS